MRQVATADPGGVLKFWAAQEATGPWRLLAAAVWNASGPAPQVAAALALFCIAFVRNSRVQAL